MSENHKEQHSCSEFFAAENGPTPVNSQLMKLPRLIIPVNPYSGTDDDNAQQRVPPSFRSAFNRMSPYTSPISTISHRHVERPRQPLALDIETTGGSNQRCKYDVKSKKQRRRKQSCVQFSHDSTTHGIRFIVRPTHAVGRAVWLVAFAAAVVASFVLVTKGVLRFLRYDVRTSTSVEYAREITFPAVTICSETVGRKSVLGQSDSLIKGFAGFMAPDNQSLKEIVERGLLSCKIAASDTTAHMEGSYDFLNRTGLVKLMSIVAADSHYSVKRCWWQQQERNCSDLFLNHFTDYNWCFTFNPAPSVIKANNLGVGWTDTAYGIKSDFKPFRLTSTGPNNGVRFLLFLHQEDYCLSHTGAAGFKVLVHDPHEQPLFSIKESYSLAPGFETNVAIRFQRVTRYTQELGRCTEQVPLTFYPNLTEYFREACYLECFTKFVYNKCDCFVPFGPPNANKIMQKLQGGGSLPMLCYGEKFVCMKQFEREFLNEGMDHRCEQCIEPCNETKSIVSLSTAVFPANQFVDFYMRSLKVPIGKLGANLSESDRLAAGEKYLRSNYAMANFYVESKLIDTIEENRDFTVEDLVSYLGGTIGFLLGMSVLSVLEFAQAFIYFLFPSFWRPP